MSLIRMYEYKNELSQLLIRMKTTTTIIYFQKKICMRTNPIHIFLNKCLYIINLYFHGTDVFEGIDVNKTSASKECDICHYWYFLNKGFNFQPNA